MFSTCLQKWVSNGHRCAGIHQVKPLADPVDRDGNVWVNSFSIDFPVNILVRWRWKLSSVLLF